MSLYTIFISVLLSLVLQAEAAIAQNDMDYVMCKNKKIVRTIRVEKAGDECKTIYTKAGLDKDVGGGKFAGSCDKIVENIKGNLEKAGWTCKPVAAAGITEANK
ncbi:MAG: hypothetical protein AABZ31_07690 [Bdellovibrionota bacterium]